MMETNASKDSGSTSHDTIDPSASITSENKTLLNTYIYDFLIKSSLDETAALFRQEALLNDVKPSMDAPQGFLYEWWQIFWDIFNARTHRGGSELAQQYFQMQLYKQRQEHAYHGIVMHAARVQQQAEQRGDYAQDIFDPMTFSMVMMMHNNATNGNTATHRYASNLPSRTVSHQNSSSQSGPQHSAQPVQMQQHEALIPTYVPTPSKVVQQLPQAQPPMQPAAEQCNSKSYFEVGHTPSPQIASTVVAMPMASLDPQHPSFQQQDQQLRRHTSVPGDSISPNHMQTHLPPRQGGSSIQGQAPLYPYSVGNRMFSVQQEVPQQLLSVPTSTPSVGQGTAAGQPISQRRRKKHSQQQQNAPMSHALNPEIVDGLHNYRKQLMILERENKKAISSSVPAQLPSATHNPQLVHRINYGMMSHLPVMSPATAQGSPNSVGVNMPPMVSMSAANPSTKKRKYTRRKTEQVKKSFSEPNSPATPLTPFTNNNLILSSTLTTVTEIPQHETISSPSILDDDDKRRKRSKKSISAQPTPPFSTDGFVDPANANGNLSSIMKRSIHQSNPTGVSSIPSSSSGNIRGSSTVMGSTSASSSTSVKTAAVKARASGKKTPGSTGSSNSKKSSISSTATPNLPPSNTGTFLPSTTHNQGSVTASTDDLLERSGASTNTGGLSPSTNIDQLANDPSLSADGPFHFDRNPPDLLESAKKSSIIDMNTSPSGLSKSNSNDCTTIAEAVNSNPSISVTASSSSVPDNRKYNSKEQDTFNLDFADPNSTYNDFNFFQFSWR